MTNKDKNNYISKEQLDQILQEFKDKIIYSLPTKEAFDELLEKEVVDVDRAEDIARGLEKLKGNKRLSAKAIKGLPIPITFAYTTTGAGVGTSVSVVDISSQCNGVLTSFLMPAYSSILMVIMTGWSPNGILRPTVDFTTPDNTHIDLVTSQVSAPATGTTLIVLYVPA